MMLEWLSKLQPPDRPTPKTEPSNNDLTTSVKPAGAVDLHESGETGSKSETSLDGSDNNSSDLQNNPTIEIEETNSEQKVSSKIH